ncbi:MAG: NAD(P)H-binding protein [Nitrospiraceae bacterium]
MANVFVTGGSGYLGSRLIAQLLSRGHTVSGLARAASAPKLPQGTRVVLGDPLVIDSFRDAVRGHDTFVHLVGVGRPAPWKAKQFRDIDLGSVKAALYAAQRAGIKHFVYLSVAHPAPVMQAYIDVRMECEARLRVGKIPTTVLRPWYVLGPGRRWPTFLLPAYRLCEAIPVTRAFAFRLGLVEIEQMITTLTWAVEHPTDGWRVLQVPDIRRGRAEDEPHRG